MDKLNFKGKIGQYSNIVYIEIIIKRYLHSVYWAVATMSTVGYGDITPINNYEIGFVVISMLSSSVIFAYSLNTIGSIISEIT